MTRRADPRIPERALATAVDRGERHVRTPLRLDRVHAARERIRLQYYDRPDVKRALVEAILIELGV